MLPWNIRQNLYYFVQGQVPTPHTPPHPTPLRLTGFLSSDTESCLLACVVSGAAGFVPLSCVDAGVFIWMHVCIPMWIHMLSQVYTHVGVPVWKPEDNPMGLFLRSHLPCFFETGSLVGSELFS